MRIEPERLMEILQGTICGTVRSNAPDLSARQLAILLIVGREAAMHTVRGLAQRLNISKPAISRSLDRLCELGLAQRSDDPRDRRSVLVDATEAGHDHLVELRQLIQDLSRQPRLTAVRHRLPTPSLRSHGVVAA